MGRALPFLALLVLQVYTFVDLVRSGADEIRSLPKPVWFLVWLVPIAGPIAWLVLGRPRVGPSSGGPGGPGGSGGGGGGITGGPRPGRGPIAPDDDPEFLRRIDERSWAARMERLRRERERGAPPQPQQDGGTPTGPEPE